jgi:ribA/ribD-fused uncharacterized protein
VTGLPHDIEELRQALRAGRRLKYLHFWGHRPAANGSIGRACLSQWWPCAFTVDGRRFATAEHYMMWRKAELFGDHEVAEQVLAAPDPRSAKGLGRAVRGFTEERWTAERHAVVLAGSLAKFGQHDDLRALLIDTGDRVLVEASPADAVWGIGVAADDPRAADPQRWPGLNLLGFALTEARERLRDTAR